MFICWYVFEGQGKNFTNLWSRNKTVGLNKNQTNARRPPGVPQAAASQSFLFMQEDK